MARNALEACLMSSALFALVRIMGAFRYAKRSVGMMFSCL